MVRQVTRRQPACITNQHQPPPSPHSILGVSWQQRMHLANHGDARSCICLRRCLPNLMKNPASSMHLQVQCMALKRMSDAASMWLSSGLHQRTDCVEVRISLARRTRTCPACPSPPNRACLGIAPHVVIRETKQDDTNVERATQNEAEPGSDFCLCARLYTRTAPAATFSIPSHQP